MTGNYQLLQVKGLLIVGQGTLDYPDFRLKVLMADVQRIKGRELIVKRLKPVLEEENVMTKGILHGPARGNGLPLRKDIPALILRKIFGKFGQLR
jgi:hypothetical protein